MRVIAQNYATGQLQMLDIQPSVGAQGVVVVRTVASVVSLGTEKSMIDIARKSLLGKALSRPDWVKQVVDKVRTEGVFEAWRQSKARLEVPVALGYSCAGVVEQVNIDGVDIRVGDGVACVGSGYASHAEINYVPPNMCVKMPDGVSFDEACYVALGGIALEAVRMARIELGHRVGVIGLGLIGQIVVQILRSAGCYVFGVDISKHRCQLALKHGAETVAVAGEEDPVGSALRFSASDGLDSVIIFTSTKSSEPLEWAAGMSRQKGRIVAGGMMGFEIPRRVFYEKELEFVVSRAWGPGMYDIEYEKEKIRYPIAHVRWTARRNIRQFMNMIARGDVKLDGITTHRFSFDSALDAYRLIMEGRESALGVVLHYDGSVASGESCVERQNERYDVSGSVGHLTKATARKVRTIGVGLIGAGLFARGTLLPAMKKAIGKIGKEWVELVGVATSGGLSGEHIKNKFGFNYCTTDYRRILSDSEIDVVFILTRHNSHAGFVCKAIESGKAVFVEKPLCINMEELKEVVKVYNSAADSSVDECNGKEPFIMVGFNRRFAPSTIKCREFFNGKNPSVVRIRCNAGYVPPDSWIHKMDEGGGRIIGEVCHFVDLAQAITGGLPARVFASSATDEAGLRDNVVASIEMENGSVVNITYASSGDKSFPREHVEVYGDGKVCVIDNFKDVVLVSSRKRKTFKSFEVDRGHVNEIVATLDALKAGESSPISFESIIATTIATFAMERSITTGKAIDINLKK